MGERVVVVCKGAGDLGCEVYLHWDGERALDLLKKAIPEMRKGDVGYSTARLVSFLCAQRPGKSTGVGVFAPPKDETEESLCAASPGDAGVLVYDVDTGITQAYAGYLHDRHPGVWKLPTPPE